MSDLVFSCTHCGARYSCPNSVARIYAGRRVTRSCESCHRLFDVDIPPNRTLRDLLFSTPHRPLTSEREWVTLVHAVASGNEDAFRTLYERMHRIVYRFMVTTHEPQTAKALTLDVFHDVWRQASTYSPKEASVVGWIMHLTSAACQPDDPVSRESRQVLDVLAELSGDVPLWIESESDWQRVGSGISYQVLARDVERERISMLVRLSPGAAYPPHTHAGVEELYLLDGELWIDSKKVVPGGFSRAEVGTSDQLVWSGTGCTCVLLTSTEDILR